MRWIKASERLPEDHAKGYYLRFITPGSFHCLAVGLFCKNELNETVVKFYSGTNGECGPDEIEWLDESDDPIPPTEENAIREEAERLYPNFDDAAAGYKRLAHISCALSYIPQLEAKEARVRELEAGVEILKELCQLKNYKDTVGKDSFYEKRQPELWKAANDYLNSQVKTKS